MKQDRYAVVVMNVAALQATVYKVYEGEEGCDDAHEAAMEWGSKPGWRASVVGI